MSTLLYVLGSGHSGSSLLDALLGLSPDTQSTGELHRLSLEPAERLCSCGATLDNCPYWTSIREFIASAEHTQIETWQQYPVSAQPDSRKERVARFLARASILPAVPNGFGTWKRKDQLAASNTIVLAKAIANACTIKLVVDSTKNPQRLLSLIRCEPSIDLKIVYLVRDGRAVAASRVRRTGTPWRIAVLRWRLDQLKASTVIRKVKDRVVLIRYEDYCADPLGTINIIRTHCNLHPLDDLQIEEGISAHMIPGNPILMDQINTIRPDDRWMNEHGPARECWFRLIAGRVARKFGY